MARQIHLNGNPGPATEARSTASPNGTAAALLSGHELRSVIDTAHEAFVSMDADGLITYWNPEAESTFGWSREEAIGRVLADTIVPEHFRESHWRGLKR